MCFFLQIARFTGCGAGGGGTGASAGAAGATCASKRCSLSEAIAFSAAQGSIGRATGGGGSEEYGEVLAVAGNGGSSF